MMPKTKSHTTINSKRKGSNFERFIARKLSLWWTGGRRDDVFWRSAASGALATIHNNKYSSQRGDIIAVDHYGSILTDVFLIELKRGYNTRDLWQFIVGGKADISTTIAHLWNRGSPFLLIWKPDRQRPILICRARDAVVGRGYLADIKTADLIHVRMYDFLSFVEDYSAAEALRKMLSRHDEDL